MPPCTPKPGVRPTSHPPCRTNRPCALASPPTRETPSPPPGQAGFGRRSVRECDVVVPQHGFWTRPASTTSHSRTPPATHCPDRCPTGGGVASFAASRGDHDQLGDAPARSEVGLFGAGLSSVDRTQAHGPLIERTGWILCAQSARNPPDLATPGAEGGIGEDFFDSMTKILLNPGSRLVPRAHILDTGPTWRPMGSLRICRKSLIEGVFGSF